VVANPRLWVSSHEKRARVGTERREKTDPLVVLLKDMTKDELTAYCNEVRSKRGIPLGLWAVVMGYISSTDVGYALAFGRDEILDDLPPH
jgi:hypothetical protein